MLGAFSANTSTGNNSYPKIGDFTRDGEWYSFDIPVSMLKSMANPLFPDADGGATAYKENAFCALSGGREWQSRHFENILKTSPQS